MAYSNNRNNNNRSNNPRGGGGRNFRNGGGRSGGNYGGSQRFNPQKTGASRDKCLDMAKEAQAMGDRVLAEQYLQQAEHYTRIANLAEESPAAGRGVEERQSADRENANDRKPAENKIADVAPAREVRRKPAPAKPANVANDAVNNDATPQEDNQVSAAFKTMLQTMAAS